MRPPEEGIRRLVAEWIAKADLDFDTVVRLVAEERFRNIVAFHGQQAFATRLIVPRHSPVMRCACIVSRTKCAMR